MLRILLADDHDVVRQGLRHLLEREPGWAVCGEARNGREAVDLARTLQPDIAIIDIAMPELNGIEATRRIRETSPSTEILVFTMHEAEELVAELFAAGARGYLIKSDAARLILAAVDALAARQPFLSARVTAPVIDAFVRDRAERSASDPAAVNLTLTPREREVLQLLAEGRRSKDIARRLDISLKTVETHRAAVMRKLDTGSIADLIRFAVRNHIVSL